MNKTDLSNLVPVHETDSQKVEEIKESLKTGWVGIPIVFHEGYLVTGHHRQQAVMDSPDLGFDIPTISLEDVFEEFDLDLQEAMEEEGCLETWDAGFVYVLDKLPAEALEKYGIQY